MTNSTNSVRTLGFVKFFQFVIRRFNRDHCVLHATTLSFTFLLSFIPFIVVSLSILASFKEFDELVVKGQDYFFKHFAPLTSSIQDVKNYITGFATKAKQVTSTGVAALVVTALLMMRSIDQSLNAVWHVRVPRKTVSSFLVYWAALTIFPILIGVSIAVSSYLYSLPFISEAVKSSGLQQTFLSFVPFFITSIAYTLMYVIVPNRPVLFRHALIGGLVAAVLFELAKRGFAVYVTQFTSYQFIYGALSTIPIFMIWIYISWLIILFGAEIARCLALVQAGELVDQQRRIELVDLLEIIRILNEAQASGAAVKNKTFLAKMPGLSDDHLIEYLDHLNAGKVVERTENGAWVLVRNLDQFSVKDLYSVFPSILPNEHFDHSQIPRMYQNLISTIQANMTNSMELSLKDLYNNASLSK